MHQTNWVFDARIFSSKSVLNSISSQPNQIIYNIGLISVDWKVERFWWKSKNETK